MHHHRRTRVVMADQHAMLSECLRLVFEMRHYDYRVVPIPPAPVRPDDLLRELRRLRPDVLLVNTELGPRCSGVSLIAPMARAGAAVVVVTETADEARWGECLAQGARTVLPKTTSLTTVIATVRKVSRGEVVLPRSERVRLLQVHRERSAQVFEVRRRLERLSRQEGEVLGHLMSGRTVAEIARRRVVAEATVRTQVKSVLAKLEVSSQLAAAAVARSAGWRGAEPSEEIPELRQRVPV